MFENTYHASMRNASRILFALALLMITVGIVVALYQFGNLTPEAEARGGWIMILNAVLGGIGNSLVPFIGAVAVHRFDARWSAPPNARGKANASPL